MEPQATLESVGSVTLDNYMADDLSVVNSARVSFSKRSETLGDPEVHLIKFLMRERHGTPFEHNSFRWHVQCPIFVAREWFRHRAGWSYNEFSGRYAKIADTHYIPDLDAVRTQVGKPGSYSFERCPETVAREAAKTIQHSNEQAYRRYQWLLSQGVAKELARTVLPVGMMTEFFATCNARSLMHFLSLRNSKHAQLEIRIIAAEMERIFAQIMPVTYEGFIENGRVAP
jgi:thymidylate synthase (FAD)